MSHTSVRHGSGRVCLVSGHTSSLWGPLPQALTLLGGVRFITWRLRRLFLEECQRSPRHFSSRLTHLKKPCATLVHLVGRRTNTVEYGWGKMLFYKKRVNDDLGSQLDLSIKFRYNPIFMTPIRYYKNLRALKLFLSL